LQQERSGGWDKKKVEVCLLTVDASKTTPVRGGRKKTAMRKRQKISISVHQGQAISHGRGTWGMQRGSRKRPNFQGATKVTDMTKTPSTQKENVHQGTEESTQPQSTNNKKIAVNGEMGVHRGDPKGSRATNYRPAKKHNGGSSTGLTIRKGGPRRRLTPDFAKKRER